MQYQSSNDEKGLRCIRIDFDYIIVGGGSAGCVLANRLTADGKNRVCLLEAGPNDRTPFITIPGAFAYFMFSRKYNWSFDAEPVADIREGKSIFCPQGKGLGGGSSINAMIYIRGHQVDYDHWAELGNRGWGWKDLLPYFRKNECNERGGDDLHGDSGPLYVSDCRNYYPINERFLKAAGEAGFPLTDDFNGPEQEGAGLLPVHHQRRKTLQRLACLPAARAKAPKPAGRMQRDGNKNSI